MSSWLMLALLAATPAADEARSSTEAPAQPLSFQEVQMVAETSAELYRRARLWFSVTYGDAHRVIDLEDPKSGTIIGKGIIPYNVEMVPAADLIRGVIRYQVTIEVKEGRYRVTVSNFMHQADWSLGLLTTAEDPNWRGQPKAWRVSRFGHMKELATLEAEGIIASLRTHMAQPVVTNSGSDW